jgi:hypothetical protein
VKTHVYTISSLSTSRSLAMKKSGGSPPRYASAGLTSGCISRSLVVYSWIWFRISTGVPSSLVSRTTVSRTSGCMTGVSATRLLSSLSGGTTATPGRFPVGLRSSSWTCRLTSSGGGGQSGLGLYIVSPVAGTMSCTTSAQSTAGDGRVGIVPCRY